MGWYDLRAAAQIEFLQLLEPCEVAKIACERAVAKVQDPHATEAKCMYKLEPFGEGTPSISDEAFEGEVTDEVALSEVAGEVERC